MSDELLDELLDGKTPRQYGICAICGKPRTVQVYVKLSELGHSGNPVNGRTVSVSSVLCSEHGIAAYNTGREAIGR